MPAYYAHHRFGAKVSAVMSGEPKEIIDKYYTQFSIGLQGPDIFFFYRPWSSNNITRYGNHLHEVSAYPFFEHAIQVISKKGRDSREYAYLMGFICHFILDSECHPYVAEMIQRTGVQHLEIEEEFEKMLLRKDKKDALGYPLGDLVPTDNATAVAIYPFYQHISPATVKKSLKWLKLIKRIFRAPGALKQGILNALMHLTGKYDYWKGLMHQRKDNPKCIASNEGLLLRFDHAIDIAVTMLQKFDESILKESELDTRFDRTFE